MIKNLRYQPLYDIKNQKRKIAIVKSTYYANLSNKLEESTKENLLQFGFKEKNITTLEVFGSWEIPYIVKKVASSKKFDGIVALGIIIKGETNHFEILSEQCSRALMDLSLELNIPVAFEILSAYNLKQVKERISGPSSKGAEVAKALAQLFKTLQAI